MMKDALRQRVLRTAALTGVVAVGVLPAAAANGSPHVKAFPPGCWIGQTAYGGTFASGGVSGKVTNGKQTFVLWVSGGATALDRVAVGFIKVTGNGSGTLAISGSKLALQVKILGDYELNGSANHVVATGHYVYSGVAKGSGQFLPAIPVKLRFPVNDAPLTILTVTPTKVTGKFLKAPWAATRQRASLAKNAAACANAA
jgi:hypothetical protein